MRVALVSYDFGEYSIRLASAISRRAEVLLAMPRNLAGPHLSKLDPTVTFRPFDKPRLRQPWRQIQTVREIHEEIRRFDPDVVHFQHGHMWFNLGLPFLGRYPLVVTVHDAKHHLGDRSAGHTPQRIMDISYRRANLLIAHSEKVREEITGRLGIAPEKIRVVPHIVLGNGAPPQPSSGWEELVVLFFGRIWDYKGLEYLIRAEPAISAEFPGVKIVIAGEGDDFARYRALMVHPERFEVHNEYVPEELAVELFQRASLVALPYVEASQSGVIPVAYNYSKPVVATNVGGLPEMVEDGRTGLLVPPRDERALASAIVSLLKDERLRRWMGARGKEKIEAEASGEAVAAGTLAVYQEALSRWDGGLAVAAGR